MGKNDGKTMTTKIVKKSNIGAYGKVRPDDFGARGGGRRRGKPPLGDAKGGVNLPLGTQRGSKPPLGGSKAGVNPPAGTQRGG